MYKFVKIKKIFNKSYLKITEGKKYITKLLEIVLIAVLEELARKMAWPNMKLSLKKDENYG